jgi:NADP-dependent 3-hydroxy acid dehydrogenase YdfG
MPKTVFITGSSAGIGKSAAIYFQQKGWNVVATMRSPEQENQLNELPNTIVLKLDVTNPENITEAIASAVKKFGKIDVLINNAGYALTGPFEEATEAQIKKQFDTNVFGLMNMCRAILPHFRANNGGTIINVASVGGRVAFPFYSLYHSTKWAVEGFTESLQHELKPFNIKVKIIEPGPIKTEFYSRSMDHSSTDGSSVYEKIYRNCLKNMQSFIDNGSSSKVVAKSIFAAADSNSNKLRYAVGGGASMMLMLRKIFPDKIFNKIIHAIAMRS